MTETMVTELRADRTVVARSAEMGIFEIKAGAVILAMGCRERPKGALGIAGARPAGIYTAGTAQKFVNMKGMMPGREVVILGSGDIGLIMARRMTLEGAKVKAVCELMPYSGGLARNIEQCLNDFDIPLLLSHTATKVHGKERVEGVTIAKVDANRRPIPETEEYIPCGCFEYYASGNGIATQAHRALRCARNYTGVLSKKPIEEVTSHDVFAAYAEGDHIAIKVLDKAIDMWGMGTANLVSLFNPEKIIFGGGVFGPAAQFIPRIYDEACKWGQPISMQDVKFCASEVQGEAALFGAAYLAIRATHPIDVM
jgi:NADPH-dependent 2,4-dienoyl-CoA reductase/sulfur reductase-like enzyme